MAYRIERVNEIIKDELSNLINYRLSDPRLKSTVVTVTSANTTPDMKYCKVYISVYGDAEKKREIMEVLAKAKGFLRKSVAAVLSTRFAPELIFELDTSLDYAMHISKILDEIRPSEEAEEIEAADNSEDDDE